MTTLESLGRLVRHTTRSLTRRPALSVVAPLTLALGIGAEPQRVSVALVSTGFFEVLGVDPLHGRTYLVESAVGNHRSTWSSPA